MNNIDIDHIIQALEIYTDDACEIYDWLHEIVCVRYTRYHYNDTAENLCTENMERWEAYKLIKYNGSDWANVCVDVVE